MKIKDIFANNNLTIQKMPYTCGPCTLLNVLLLKGNRQYSEEELAKLCGTTTRSGTSNENLVHAAKQIGLELIEEKANADIADIERNTDDGNLVIVSYLHTYSGEGHYGLVMEHDEQAFYFRDCSYGFMRLNKKHFDKFWYGTDGIRKWYMAVK